MSGGEGEPKAGGLMTSERVGPAFEDGVTWIELRSETRSRDPRLGCNDLFLKCSLANRMTR